MRTLARIVAGAFLAALAACAPAPTPTPDMNSIAEQYVKLVLRVGQHDTNFVDAYYGDESWRPKGTAVPLPELASQAAGLQKETATIKLLEGTDEAVRLRKQYLEKQLAAVATRITMLLGGKLSFDDEAKRLYDAEPPHLTDADFQPVLDELEKALPGKGPLLDRYTTFRNKFIIPTAKLDAVFVAAIEGCRDRTAAHMKLPAGETFTVEYVKGKSWSAYNWYKGKFTSVIQVNTDLPITIDRAIDLACHEGYPGHHVYNALLEQHLVRERGWVEFSIYPLFSPQSLIAEGTANFGIDVAFPGEARTAFERDTLYPIAGLDASAAEKYTAVQKLIGRLSYAGNEAARKYLNGEINREAAAAYLQKWAMSPKDRAEQRTRFFDEYRSYVINYNLGQDLVREYVEKRGGTADQPEARWKIFGELLSSPRLPSGLR